MPTMPNVVGVGVYQATTSLISAGIVPDNGLLPTGSFVNLGYFDRWPVSLTWVQQTGTPAGNVISQLPTAGTTNVALNTPVTLTVSNFPMAVADLFSAGGYS